MRSARLRLDSLRQPDRVLQTGLQWRESGAGRKKWLNLRIAWVWGRGGVCDDHLVIRKGCDAKPLAKN